MLEVFLCEKHSYIICLYIKTDWFVFFPPKKVHNFVDNIPEGGLTVIKMLISVTKLGKIMMKVAVTNIAGSQLQHQLLVPMKMCLLFIFFYLAESPHNKTVIATISIYKLFCSEVVCYYWDFHFCQAQLSPCSNPTWLRYALFCIPSTHPEHTLHTVIFKAKTLSAVNELLARS